MRTLLAVVLPLAVQVLIFAALIFGFRGGGSFVALGAMLVGIIAVPATTILNWARVRSKTQDPLVWLIATALFNVLLVPALLLLALGLSS